MDLAEYYQNPHVVHRLVEYMGGTDPVQGGCVYIAECKGPTGEDNYFHAPHTLDAFLQQRMELSRSLWDRRFLLVHMDLEYVNFDFPAEPFIHPRRSFAMQAPVMEAFDGLLCPLNIFPLKLISGRGFHLVWQVDTHSEIYRRIAALGAVPRHILHRYAEVGRRFGACIESALAAAYQGLGMVMEFLAFLALDRAGRQCPIPVEITAVKCGPQYRGREIISIDLSEYGDPLDTRGIRIPFSAYLKHCRHPYIDTADAGARPPLFMIPLAGQSVFESLRLMRDPVCVAALAATSTVRIPDHTAAMHQLLDLYIASDLARFHHLFYSQSHEPPECWPDTYDRTPLDDLPPCIAFILRHPNPHLLQPAAIRQLVRSMMALGWHPRHIAGLIRSKYERDHDWGMHWITYDPASRADFYTRLFGGLFATGRDELVDFNCISSQEKDLCFAPRAGCHLYDLRSALLERRNHE